MNKESHQTNNHHVATWIWNKKEHYNINMDKAMNDDKRSLGRVVGLYNITIPETYDSNDRY